MKQYLPVDIETTGLSFNRDRILGIGYGETYNTAARSIPPLPCTAQNGRFEYKFMKRAGIPWHWEFDTLLAASILIDRPQALDLASLASYYLGQESWKSDTDKLFKKKNWVQLLEASPELQKSLADRNLHDLSSTKELTTVLLKKLEDEGMTSFFFDKLMPAARMLADTEYQGMRIDVPATEKKLTQINEQLGQLKARLDAWVGNGFTYLDEVKEQEVEIGIYTREEWEKITAEEKALDARIGIVGLIDYTYNEECPPKKTKTEKMEIYKTIEKLNWNSPIQLKKFLKNKGYNLWTYDFKKKDMVESTGSDVLERLSSNPNIKLLLEYRGAVKLKGFLEGWLEEHYEGRLFPSYNIANTRTGRLSCSGPNLQQVPRDKSVRSLFIPSEDKVFVIADYAQIEPRVAAHYTGDEALRDVFVRGLDFYGSIAVNVLGAPCGPNEVKTLYPNLRKVAKEIGLSILYGIGAKKLINLIEKKAGIIFNEQQGRKIIKDYFKAYPRLEEFRKYVEGKINRGEVLKTHYGRQFLIDPAKAFSTGVNSIVQATASDACLFSQLEVDNRLKALGIDAPLVAIIHDEIIRECTEEQAPTVGKIMEEVMTNQGFSCPIKLDWTIGKSWGDKA